MFMRNQRWLPWVAPSSEFVHEDDPLSIHFSKASLISGYESEFWNSSGYREILFSFTKALNLSFPVRPLRLPKGSFWFFGL